MALQGVGQHEGRVATIDLTLSPSPEPQARPAPATHNNVPQGQRTIPTRVKSESSVTAGRPLQEYGQKPNVQARTRIDHVHHIIRTSDPQAIKNVLFDLCKLSPALCGAIARGLAPHSDYGRAVLRDATPQRAKQPAVKREPTIISAQRRPPLSLNIKEEAGRSASYQRRKPTVKPEAEDGGYLSDSSDSPMILSSPKITPSTLKQERKIRSTPTAPRSFGTELNASPAPSDTSSTAFSDTAPPMRSRKDGPRLDAFRSANIAGSSHSHTAPRPAKAELDSSSDDLPRIPSFRSAQKSFGKEPANNSSTSRRLVCKQCNKAFYEGTKEPCIYHPGQKRRMGPGKGSFLYTCCQKAGSLHGCTTASHSAVNISQTESSKREASEPGPSLSFERNTKIPRLL